MESPTLFATHTRVTTAFDVGFGTGQVANLNVIFNAPLIVDRLVLRSALYNTWQRTAHTSVNTLMHLLLFLLDGRIGERLSLFADLSAAYHHALVRVTYPFGGQMQLRLGAMYAW